MKRWLKPLVLTLIGLTPIISSINYLGFEQSKVIFFLFLSLILVLLWALGKLSIKENQKLVNSPIKIFALLFIIVLAITSMLGINPTQSIIGAHPYLQGLIIYFLLYLIFIITNDLDISLTEISLTLSIPAFFVSSLSIYQWLQINLFHELILTYGGRVISTFGQPNLYSGFLLMVLPFLFIQIKNQKIKVWFLICLLFVVVAVIISQSRTAISLLGLIFVLELFLHNLWGKNTIKNIYPNFLKGLLIVCIVLGGLGIWQIYKVEVADPLNSEWLKYNAPEKRIYIWNESLNLIFQKPITGYGLENISDGFVQSMKNQPNQSAIQKSLLNIGINRTHNYFLDIWFFSGLVGLIVYLLFLKQVLLGARKQSAVLISFIVYLVLVFLNPQSIVQLLLFWFLAGWVATNKVE